MSDPYEHEKGRSAWRLPAVQDHSRLWGGNLYVYPVISRRAAGLSIGVNLSPSQKCNFHCVYCQVNRPNAAGPVGVDLGTLIRELNAMLDMVASGELWASPPLAAVPAEIRRINDIAFSGDGEPTACRNFPHMVQVVADAKARHKLADVKIVVISNASRFHTQVFRRALPILEANNGEIWAKLDAGSSERFTRIHRTSVPFKNVLANIESLARAMPIVIQSCFFRLDGLGPTETEIELYVARLRHVLEVGGRLKYVQAYTIARPPAETSVTALSDAELDAIAGQVRRGLEGLRVECFYGTDTPVDVS